MFQHLVGCAGTGWRAGNREGNQDEPTVFIKIREKGLFDIRIFTQGKINKQLFFKDLFIQLSWMSE